MRMRQAEKNTITSFTSSHHQSSDFSLAVERIQGQQRVSNFFKPDINISLGTGSFTENEPFAQMTKTMRHFRTPSQNTKNSQDFKTQGKPSTSLGRSVSVGRFPKPSRNKPYMMKTDQLSQNNTSESMSYLKLPELSSPALTSNLLSTTYRTNHKGPSVLIGSAL